MIRGVRSAVGVNNVFTKFKNDNVKQSKYIKKGNENNDCICGGEFILCQVFLKKCRTKIVRVRKKC